MSAELCELADVGDDGSCGGVHAPDCMGGGDGEVEVDDGKCLRPGPQQLQSCRGEDVDAAESTGNEGGWKRCSIFGRNCGSGAGAFEEAFGGMHPAAEEAVAVGQQIA